MKGEQTDAKREVRGLMTRVKDMEGRGGERRESGREGGLALEAAACRIETKKIIKPIHELFMYLF